MLTSQSAGLWTAVAASRATWRDFSDALDSRPIQLTGTISFRPVLSRLCHHYVRVCVLSTRTVLTHGLHASSAIKPMSLLLKANVVDEAEELVLG